MFGNCFQQMEGVSNSSKRLNGVPDDKSGVPLPLLEPHGYSSG